MDGRPSKYVVKELREKVTTLTDENVRLKFKVEELESEVRVYKDKAYDLESQNRQLIISVVSADTYKGQQELKNFSF